MAIVTGYVHISHPETAEPVTFQPGDTLPEWAESIVTNPAILYHGPTAAPEPAAPEPADDEPSEPAEPEKPKLTREQVVARAKELGVNAKGKTEVLLERIAEAERAAADNSDDTPEPSSRSSLEARARELGIEFDDETTDSELELLIQSKE